MDIGKSTGKIFGARVIGSVTSFVGIALFARGLGASQLGTFFLFQAALGILTIPADFGIRDSVEKRVSEGLDLSSAVSTALVLKLILTSAVAITLFTLRRPLTNYLGADVVPFLILALILRETAYLTLASLRGELRVGETASVQIIQPLVWVGGGLLLMHFGYGVRAPIYSLILAFALMTVVGAYRTNARLTTPRRDHTRALLSFSKYIFISSVGGYLYQWLDVAILGYFVGQSAVGAYEVAWRITSVMLLLGQSIASVVFPQVSSWDAENAYRRIEELLPRAITPSLFLTIPGFFGSLALSTEILDVVFGPEYTIAALALVILMGEKVVQSAQMVLGRALQGIDRPDTAAKIAVISVLLNVILNLLLIPRFGIIGAAVATGTSFLLNSTAHAYALHRFVPIRLPWREIIWYVLSSVGMLGVVSVFISHFPASTLLRLVVAIGLGATCYFVFVLLYPDTRMRIQEIMARFV